MKRLGVVLGFLFLAAFACSKGPEGDVAVCGDGVVSRGEQCDPPDGVLCSSRCMWAFCGDGIVEGSEECDEGAFDSDTCTHQCTKPRCGDGILSKGEECDNGAHDDHGPCTSQCKIARCGDGLLEIGVEQCDEGANNGKAGNGGVESCTVDCKTTRCGDGLVEPPEQCDNGEHNVHSDCPANCLRAFCGDGYVWAGHEQCDDGPANDDHGHCTTSCTLARCGDGFVQPENGEQCDDGNDDDTDACPNDCKQAFCGDGYVWAGHEECDDGNTIDTDACPSDCKVARCGDGFVHAGFEQCDDGPANCDGCNCESDCKNASCGNCIVDPGEQCDDCNDDNTDGCLMTCQQLDLCKGFAITGVAPAEGCTVDPKPPTQLTLTASGLGFLTVGGKKPSVTFNGAPAAVLSLSNAGNPCTPIYGAFNQVQSCTTMVIAIPTGLAAGSYTIEVVNPTTEKCPNRKATYVVGGPPTITQVNPNPICQGLPKSFTIVGTGFTPATTVTFTGPKAPKTPVPNSPTVTFIDANDLQVDFPDLNPGFYDVTVANGTCTSTKVDGAQVLPDPFVFFVDPPVIYNGINTRATAYVANINGGKVNFVGGRPNGVKGIRESFNYVFDATKPSQVQVDITANSAVAAYGSPRQVGYWDMFLDDGESCPGMLQKAFKVVNATTFNITSVDPPFGWTNTKTDVSLSSNGSFVNAPSVYLNPSGNANAFATKLNAVNFLNASQLTATVPAGLTVGKYDVIVVNPDGGVAVLLGGFTVTQNAPPTIDDIAPGSLPNNADGNITVLGHAFDAAATASLTCRDTNGNVTNPAPVTATFVSATQLTVSIPAKTAGMPLGDVCVVRVTNPDSSYGEYSALGITNASGNITGFANQLAMQQVRRAPAVASGKVTGALHQLWAFGGDTGTPTTALATAETVALDKFGAPVDPSGGTNWRNLPVALPAPLTFAHARTVRRFVYLAGGNGGGGASDAKNGAFRAKILDPSAVTSITQLTMVPDPVLGQAAGLWYYRVSAVMAAADAYNPNGEELPSDALPVIVPASVGQPVQVRIDWTAIAGAAKYLVYRSPTPNLVAGQEQLLATVNAPTTFYNDTGGTTTSQVPRKQGDLGTWVALPNLNSARQGLSLAVVQNTSSPLPAPCASAAEMWHLYALGGSNGATSSVLSSYELLSVCVNADGTQSMPSGWTAGGANTFGTAAWQLGGHTLDFKVSTKVPNAACPAPCAFIYVSGGLNGAGAAIGEVDAAQVDFGNATPGLLKSWQLNVGSISTTAAGHGAEIGSDQVFVLGGIAGAPSTHAKSAFICPSTGCASNPPAIKSFNDNGSGLVLGRWQTGSTTESAHFFLVGGNITAGDTTAAGQTGTCESTIW